MKKALTLSAIFLCIMVHSVFADVSEEKISPENTHFYIGFNDEILDCQYPYYQLDNELYFPLRGVAEELGMTVDWNAETDMISIDRDSSDYLMPFEDENTHLWGYKNTIGDIVIPPTYYWAGNFYDERAVVELKFNECGYIDKKGDLVIPAMYKQACDFIGGIALVTIGDPNTTDTEQIHMYIDTMGNQVFPETFLSSGSFSENYAVVLKSGPWYPTPPSWGLKQEWSYINTNGTYATDIVFDDALPFSNGLAAVKINDKWTIINTDFQVLEDYQFDTYNELSDAMLPAPKYEKEVDIELKNENILIHKKAFVIKDFTYVSKKDLEEILNYKSTWTPNLPSFYWRNVLYLSRQSDD